MPSIDIQIMEGVFSAEDKKLMIEKVTDALGEVVGDTLRAGTTVRIHEIKSGSWGYGGQPKTTEDAKGWRSQG